MLEKYWGWFLVDKGSYPQFHAISCCLSFVIGKVGQNYPPTPTFRKGLYKNELVAYYIIGVIQEMEGEKNHNKKKLSIFL